jgi:gamma-tubulin complex component 5
MLERIRLVKDDKISDDDETPIFYCVRHRLLWFVTTLYLYVAEIVLATATARMRKSLQEAADVDEMIEVHHNYIVQLEDQILLSKKLAPIHQAIISLLDMAILFFDAYTTHAGQQTHDMSNRSQNSGASILKSHRQRRRRVEGSSSSSEDDSGEDEVGDSSYITFEEETFPERLQKMRGRFEQLCGFVSAGLRGVARAGGQSCWEVLAEKLEWGIEKSTEVT